MDQQMSLDISTSNHIELSSTITIPEYPRIEFNNNIFINTKTSIET